MYEPIRGQSVHTTATPDVAYRSREDELDIRLAGHLTALLTVTDELRALTPGPGLDAAAQRLAAESTRLSGGRTPLRAEPTTGSRTGDHITALHQRAHTLAGMALVIADAREDEAASTLAMERRYVHEAALDLAEAA
ncbi:hypothetical protein [Streptomyces oceani]|uniref:Uncharacterized protein n=1 Tax=Streptomyces oceani TaxID=1075402 RepID=A0A1E7KLK7_9ACTN|nr:hypothetical protein [Streptomyces oceani]OEV04849.1 hypothetical protein AN216_05350 [Streptomyces oceani]